MENTGNIHKYTLQEIADALKTDPETIEKFGTEPVGFMMKERNVNKNQTDKLKETISLQKEEIAELKSTIKEQWKVIQELSRRKKS